jgi:protein MAK11
MWDLLKGRSAFISRLHHSQDHYEVGLSKKFRPMPEKLRWNQQGTRYAISYADGIDVFSMSEPDSVKHIRTPTARQRINCMAFHQLSEQPAGEDYLVVGYEDGMVRVWGCDGEDGDGDINNKQPLAELKAHDGRVKDISVIKSSRGTLLLTISSNGVLRVWDLDSFIIQPSLPLANPQFMLGEHDTKGSRLTCLAVQMMNAAAAADAVKEDDEDELIQSMEGSSSDEDEQGEEEEEAESQVSSSSSSSSEEEVEQQQNKRRAKFSMRMPMKNKSNKRTRNK